MPSVCRLGDLCTGHGCWGSRPNDSASTNVFINNRGAHRLGDHWVTHCCSSCHDGSLISGSSTVYVNGLPLGRIGDAVSCGSSVMTGSSTVHAG